MDKKFQEVINQFGPQLGLNLNEDIIDIFYIYYRTLIEENSKYNLTAITSPEEVAEKHFLDSLTLIHDLNEISGKKIVDIGTGAGFPGLPIKIYNPGLHMTLIDSVNKKIMFLEKVIEKIQLNKVEAIHARAEEVAEGKRREFYDAAVSRAVAELRVLVEYTIPLVKVGGLFIAAKGPNIKDELKDANNAINILGGQVENVREFKLPVSQEGRTVIVIRKIKSTPKNYPRRAGIPKKRPL